MILATITSVPLLEDSLINWDSKIAGGEWLHEEVKAKYMVWNFSVELYLEPYPNANMDANLNGKFPSIASSYSSMLSQPSIGLEIKDAVFSMRAF